MTRVYPDFPDIFVAAPDPIGSGWWVVLEPNQEPIIEDVEPSGASPDVVRFWDGTGMPQQDAEERAKAMNAGYRHEAYHCWEQKQTVETLNRPAELGWTMTNWKRWRMTNEEPEHE